MSQIFNLRNVLIVLWYAGIMYGSATGILQFYMFYLFCAVAFVCVDIVFMYRGVKKSKKPDDLVLPENLERDLFYRFLCFIGSGSLLYGLRILIRILAVLFFLFAGYSYYFA